MKYAALGSYCVPQGPPHWFARTVDPTLHMVDVSVVSPGSVDVAPMVDPVDGDYLCVFVDPVDDAVRSDMGATPARQLTFECVTQSSRIDNEASEAELNNGTNDAR